MNDLLVVTEYMMQWPVRLMIGLIAALGIALLSKGESMSVFGYALLGMAGNFLPLALFQLMNHPNTENSQVIVFLVASVVLMAAALFMVTTPFLNWKWVRA